MKRFSSVQGDREVEEGTEVESTVRVCEKSSWGTGRNSFERFSRQSEGKPC